MTVKYILKREPRPRLPLTPEQIAEIEARAPREEDILYDADCPPMTEEQLKQFKRVHPRSKDSAASGK